MDSNKDEADRCILIAEKHIKDRNREKAEKFLHKAERLFPTQKAKDLLEQIQFLAPGNPETEQPRKRTVAPKVDEKVKKPEYTPEQEAAVKRIQQCKDYYEILNVKKDATDSDMKKAYKKLALVLHPDKNSHPGSAEAFKKVVNALAVLTDTVKRKHYDQYGEEDRLASSRSNHHHNTHFATDASAEDIFNMFFGGGFAESNVYVRRGGRWQRQTTASQGESHHAHNHQQRDNQAFSGFIQLLPILLAIVLSMASSFFISDPAYSLQASSKYPIQRRTHNLDVPYFVKENFYSEYQGSVKRLELSVEEDYITSLRHACYREKNYRDSMIWKAKNFGDRELFHTAQNMKTPSCDTLNQLRNRG